MSDVRSDLSRQNVNQKTPVYKRVIDDICDLDWGKLTEEDLIGVAWVYYYFSIQFRESLEIACQLYPADQQLQELDRGERNTDNLSPWPGVASVGERMNHDEFMRRVIESASLDQAARDRVDNLGREYLAEVGRMDPLTRAMALSSYEDGGLETVFTAMLTAPDWNEPSLGAFKHFLVEHIRLDSGEHGSLCRHIVADDRILPLWKAFRNLLAGAAPRLCA
jgi:hypothetical protein